jgi:GTP-binding protein EngB required for normal cell division
MKQQQRFQNLANYLRSAVGILQLERNSQLRQDTLSLCDYLNNPSFSIAVFAPFNYGKSTLLNALLGNKTLPIDIIPTTGAAIYVRYHHELQTKIALKDGREIIESGTDILKTYAILDEQRYMHRDVARVEVYCQNPFLQTGVEFIDLPGTDDREEQDRLVKDKLLTVDLVVQVLDGRKLMTLSERENLRDWLLDRGINTVVFVVNFLNLLEPEDQKEVYNRLRFVAESFRADLPVGISNLYRVDALPALRARLKGDTAAAQISGLNAFESALQTIVQSQKARTDIRLLRVINISKQIIELLQEKHQALVSEISSQKQSGVDKTAIKKRAKQLIVEGLQKSISELESWLYLPNLLSKYQRELVKALQENKFNYWHTGEFKTSVLNYQQIITGWVTKGCEFFGLSHPGELNISFPRELEINVVTNEGARPSEPSNNNSSIPSLVIPTGLGWVLGGPVGAVVLGGASYILNKVSSQSEEEDLTNEPVLEEIDWELIAREYLTEFSQWAFISLYEYQKRAENVLDFEIVPEVSNQTLSEYQLQFLNNLLDGLQQTIDSSTLD